MARDAAHVETFAEAHPDRIMASNAKIADGHILQLLQRSLKRLQGRGHLRVGMLRHRPLAILIRVAGLANLGGGILTLDKELRVFFSGFVRYSLSFLGSRVRGRRSLGVGGVALKEIIAG